jgi:hypothetical protein
LEKASSRYFIFLDLLLFGQPNHAMHIRVGGQLLREEQCPIALAFSHGMEEAPSSPLHNLFDLVFIFNFVLDSHLFCFIPTERILTGNSSI